MLDLHTLDAVRAADLTFEMIDYWAERLELRYRKKRAKVPLLRR